MKQDQEKIYLATRKYYFSSRKTMLASMMAVAVFCFLPLGVVRFGNTRIPWYMKEIVFTLIFTLRCCMFCFISDLVNGLRDRHPFRCIRWPKTYSISFAIALSYQRIIIPLFQMLVYAALPFANGFLRALLLMFAYMSYSITTYFFDSYLIKLVISNGQIPIKKIIKGWIPMLVDRLKLELRLGKVVIIPLLGTFFALYTVQGSASASLLELILFIGQSLFWGVGFYYVPMQMIARFLHSALNYYEESIPFA